MKKTKLLILLLAFLSLESIAQDFNGILTNFEKGRMFIYKETNGDTIAFRTSRVIDIIGDKNNGRIVIKNDYIQENGSPIIKDSTDKSSMNFLSSYNDTIYVKNGDVQKKMSSILMPSINEVFSDLEEETKNTNDLNEEQKEKLDEMLTVTIKSENFLTFPCSLKVGDKLDEYALKIKMSLFTVNFYIDKRKVTDHKTINTNAGDFDAYLITGRNLMRFMIASEKSFIKEWYSHNYGLIKGEEYDNDDKLVSTTELYKIINQY